MIVTGESGVSSFGNTVYFLSLFSVLKKKVTEENLRGMRENMDENDLEDFDKFVERHWKKNKENVLITSGETMDTVKKRGRKPKNQE